ncbi:MAG: hypothetical protein AAF970_03570 [Bacteroidota bacterium]
MLPEAPVLHASVMAQRLLGPSVLCTVLAAILLTGCVTTSNDVPLRAGRVPATDQDLKLVTYNVAFGAVAGGLGALLNGQDGPPLRRFARGAGWGAAGGGVSYLGKWQAGAISENERLIYGLPARLLHDTGISIIENAALDRPPLDRLATHLGVVRLDVRPRSGHVQVRLLPVTTLLFAVLLADPDVDFALGRSLVYGAPLFSGNGPETAPITGGSGNGRAFPGVVFVNRQDEEFHDTAAHELVHAFQFREMARVEATLWRPLDASLRQGPGYRRLARWIYLDSPVLALLSYFVVEGGKLEAPCKYDNWLELEAEAFGSRRPVGVCP